MLNDFTKQTFDDEHRLFDLLPVGFQFTIRVPDEQSVTSGLVEGEKK